MKKLYFDESGDLGFDFTKSGTSNKLSIAFLFVKNTRQVKTLVKKVFTSIPKTKRNKHCGTLHAYYEKEATVRKLLCGLAEKDVGIATICLDKRKVLVKGDPNELYANIIISLINRLYADGTISGTEDITLIASRRNTSKSLNAKFAENIISHTKGSRINIEIVKPSNDRCLQAVDFVSWAFWQKYEKGDSAYADLLSEKVLHEYEMYE